MAAFSTVASQSTFYNATKIAIFTIEAVRATFMTYLFSYSFLEWKSWKCTFLRVIELITLCLAF